MNEYCDRFIRFILALERVDKAVGAVKNQYMTPSGLRGSHVMCLCQLMKEPDGLTSAELARRCRVDRAFVSRTVGELSCEGYLSAEGGRRARLRLTEKGKALAEKMEGMLEDGVTTATDGITPSELETMYAVMAKIESNLSQRQGKDAFSDGDNQKGTKHEASES